MTLATVSLDDKYLARSGRIFVTGTQALVRLALVQRRRDSVAGIETRGFISGYRGSPLGGLDQALTAAGPLIASEGIVFTPGVNEDLAATAVSGTQQVNLLERANCDGVFGIWYGKGPGVDRSGDAFRHGNLAGSAPQGGVLLLLGDDHTCKSSTTSHQSEYAMVDAMIPVLNPAGVGEIIAFGLFGIALSRFSGCWSSLKLIAETMDSSASISTAQEDVVFEMPDIVLPEGGVHIRWPDLPQQQEQRLHRHKLPAVLAFARKNRIDRVVLTGPRRKTGIVTTGKSYLDVQQALDLLGLDERGAADLGLCLYKVGMSWPLEPEGAKAFADGLETLLVVEEKRPLIEGQIKDLLYGLPDGRRPRIFGKLGPNGNSQLPAHDDLTPAMIARAIVAALGSTVPEELSHRLRAIETSERAPHTLPAAPVARTPYFCSGCPHSTSTRLPEGSRGMAGIGCSWMSLWMDRSVSLFTHMGGEGANWIGQAPFVPTRHIFQNLGDGTYFHSGLLAIRAAVAAKVNITYKILFNDAVAMTGGQRHDGALDPRRIARQVLAEGVVRTVIVADDPSRYDDRKGLDPLVSVHHRSELDAVQRDLRELEGVSILIYDQVCAAEKRRRRKRAGTQAPPMRVLINERVCESCGDCSRASNCLSVTPVDTEFGRKRRIDQSSCNTDLSCVNGFCPSFVTIAGVTPRKGRAADIESLLAHPLGEPRRPALDAPYNVLVTGVGGTGVVTIGAILAMAAHIEGLGCSTLDMTGMAQKGGPVTTHLRFAASVEALHAVRVPIGAADAVLGGDLVVAAGKESLGVMAKGRTRVILNTQETITSGFVKDRDFDLRSGSLRSLVEAAAGREQVDAIAATALANRLFGDAIATNLFMVGYAYQRGLIPVSSESVLAAIELNGAAVALNRSAFRLGRLAAQAPALLLPERPDEESPDHRRAPLALNEVIDRRADELTAYQDKAYARSYLSLVARVREREREVAGQEGALSEAVAHNLFKLMAYKDEYEVARLYTAPAFLNQVSEAFEGTPRLTLHLAPPLLARKDPATGRPKKMSFGPWILTLFRLLARLKFLRSTRLDPFGYTAERRQERALIRDYREAIEQGLAGLTREKLALTTMLARLPEDIRGFGHVKEDSIRKARARWSQLQQQLTNGRLPSAAE